MTCRVPVCKYMPVGGGSSAHTLHAPPSRRPTRRSYNTREHSKPRRPASRAGWTCSRQPSLLLCGGGVTSVARAASQDGFGPSFALGQEWNSDLGGSRLRFIIARSPEFFVRRAGTYVRIDRSHGPKDGYERKGPRPT